MYVCLYNIYVCICIMCNMYALLNLPIFVFRICGGLMGLVGQLDIHCCMCLLCWYLESVVDIEFGG